MTTKIYARQVPPEEQQSPLNFYGEFDGYELYGAEIYGNRHYKRNTTTLFDSIPEALDGLCWEWEEMHAGRQETRDFNTWADALADLVPPEGRTAYTRQERKKDWPAVVLAYHNADYITPEIYAAALSLITGQEWDCCTLRGCCQGDWQNCIYRVDLWDGPALERLEAEYFNTGTEWTFEEETEGGCCSVYCYEWSDDGIRREIADAAGVAPEAVTLYKFTGYTRTAQYEEV